MNKNYPQTAANRTAENEFSVFEFRCGFDLVVRKLISDISSGSTIHTPQYKVLKVFIFINCEAVCINTERQLGCSLVYGSETWPVKTGNYPLKNKAATASEWMACSIIINGCCVT